MFKIGDVVIYSASGVCRVEDICDKSFGSFSAKYYILKPLLQKSSTVFVPTQNSNLTSKMHTILSQEDFKSIFRSVSKKEPVRPESESERHDKFAEILESGNREALMLMVYDLHNFSHEQQQNGRRLHIADEKLLNTAENMLFEEIAYVFGIDKTAAPDFLKEQISL